MKKLFAIAVLLLMTVGAYAQEGRNIYNKYSDNKGVSAVYVSPAMFKMIGKIPDLDVEVGDGEKMDLAPLIKNLKGFYLLDISNSEESRSLITDVENMVRKGRYELIMEVKEDGERVNIFTSGDEKTIDSFVFLCHSEEEIQFICIDGAMNRTDVENMIAKMAQ